jgi:hypothetical protein
MQYYLNRNAQNTKNHEHELHEAHCSHPPFDINRIYIGDCDTPESAMRRAKFKYPSFYIDGCAYCCPSLNNG